MAQCLLRFSGPKEALLNIINSHRKLIMSDIFIQSFESKHNPNIKYKDIFPGDISLYDIYCQLSNLAYSGTKEQFNKFLDDLPVSLKKDGFEWYESISDGKKLSHKEYVFFNIYEKINDLNKKFNGGAPLFSFKTNKKTRFGGIIDSERFDNIEKLWLCMNKRIIKLKKKIKFN